MKFPIPPITGAIKIDLCSRVGILGGRLQPEVQASAMGQNRRFEKRCPNGRFLIRKRTLVKDTMNGRSWPISAVPIQSTPMSELGQLRTLATYRCDVCFQG